MLSERIEQINEFIKTGQFNLAEKQFPSLLKLVETNKSTTQEITDLLILTHTLAQHYAKTQRAAVLEKELHKPVESVLETIIIPINGHINYCIAVGHHYQEIGQYDNAMRYY